MASSLSLITMDIHSLLMRKDFTDNLIARGWTVCKGDIFKFSFFIFHHGRLYKTLLMHRRKIKEPLGEATIKSAPSSRTGLSLFPLLKNERGEYLSLISAASSRPKRKIRDHPPLQSRKKTPPPLRSGPPRYYHTPWNTSFPIAPFA